MENKALILVVDDEPKNIRLLTAILEKFNANVSVALDAFRAKKILDTITPDIILLDVMMPGKTGFELCEEIKSEEHLKDIPVIFLTAKNGIDDTKKGFELGAVDYITKPFRQEELIARMTTHLQLHRTRKELRRRLEEKSEIVGMVAHDLNNPIFAIKAFSEMLQEDLQTDADKMEMVTQIIKATSHMQNIVKRILSLEELEIDEKAIEHEVYDLGLILDGTIAMNKPHANDKKIEFDFKSTDICLIRVDGFRIKEILDNLISNAVKYSPINSKIFLRIDKPNEKWIHFIIEDEGPGFTEEDMTRVFKKFQKLSARPTAGEYSSGLGLYIVKKLVEDLGGEILLESPIKDHKGTRITVKIPAAPVEDA
jgi:two-component system sensor histidine kinase/response regulator